MQLTRAQCRTLLDFFNRYYRETNQDPDEKAVYDIYLCLKSLRTMKESK